MPYFTVRGPMAIPTGDSAAFTNFIARTSGLDATHTNAYKALLNGLTTDGFFNSDGTTNYFDALYIFATQDATTALLNLVSATFNATAQGAPTFTADNGFNGVVSSTTVYIETGFNPTTASSPKYTLNSAHASGWSMTDVDEAGAIFGAVGPGPSKGTTQSFPWLTNQAFYQINDPTGGESAAVATGTSLGHYVCSRTTNILQDGYRNGSSVGITPVAVSSQLFNCTIVFLARDNEVSGIENGSSRKVTMGSIGKGLTAGEVTLFYNRLRTYMTTVGVP